MIAYQSVMQILRNGKHSNYNNHVFFTAENLEVRNVQKY